MKENKSHLQNNVLTITTCTMKIKRIRKRFNYLIYVQKAKNFRLDVPKSNNLLVCLFNNCTELQLPLSSFSTV